MIQRGLILGVTAFASACTTQSEVVPLKEISDNPRLWDGKVVMVEGWLLHCADLNCFIVPTRADLELIYNACPGERCELAIEAFDQRAVSIGYDEAFDRSAKPLQGSHVLVAAKVNAGEWLQPSLDRSAALEPISINPYGE